MGAVIASDRKLRVIQVGIIESTARLYGNAVKSSTILVKVPVARKKFPRIVAKLKARSGVHRWPVPKSSWQS